MTSLKTIYSKPDRYSLFGINVDTFKDDETLKNRLSYLLSYPRNSLIIFLDFPYFFSAIFSKKRRKIINSASLIFSKSKLLNFTFKLLKGLRLEIYKSGKILSLVINILENSEKTCYIIDKSNTEARKTFFKLKSSYPSVNFIRYYDFKSLKEEDNFFLKINKLTPSIILSFSSKRRIEEIFYYNRNNIMTNVTIFF